MPSQAWAFFSSFVKSLRPFTEMYFKSNFTNVTMQNSISTKVIQQTFAQQTNQWQNASFNLLTDAFNQPGQLRVSAFQLSLQDTLALVNNPETRFLVIHMGLVVGKWYPILQGKSSLNANSMENAYLPTLAKEPLALGTNNYSPTIAYNPHIITPAVAQEYVENWQKTSPSQIMDVFHAPILTNKFHKMERLRYAYFGEEVAQELRAMQPDHLTIFAGNAATTTQNQPFTFRPVVLATRDHLNMMFDLSTPVPPFPLYY